MNVLLIEDHPIVRAGCARVLQQRPGVEVLEAQTAAEGLAAALSGAPDVIVLDLNLPDRRGLEVLADLRAARAAPVVIFSMYEDAAFVAAALAAGAAGYVTKNDDPDLLLEAIDRVLRGEVFVSPVAARQGDDDLSSLTAREQRLLALLADGKVLGEAAGALGVSYRTTAEDAARLRVRFGLRSNAALIKFAVERAAR